MFNDDNSKDMLVRFFLPTILKLGLFTEDYPRSCELNFCLVSVFLRVLRILNLYEHSLNCTRISLLRDFIIYFGNII